MMIDTTSVIGYARPLDVRPGEKISFNLSSATLASADIGIVRVRCGDPDQNGPGLKLIAVPSPIDGTVALVDQPTHTGSYGMVADNELLAGLQEFSIGLHLFPTIVGGLHQTIFARWNETTDTGWKLELDAEGHVVFAVAGQGNSHRLRSTVPVLKREWIFVGASVSLATGQLALFGSSLARDGGRARDFLIQAETAAGGAWPAETPLLFAAQWTGAASPQKPTNRHFNGRIDRPRLYGAVADAQKMRQLVEAVESGLNDPLLLGAWDFAQRVSSDDLVDLSANRLNGVVRRMPMRAATGANWTGTIQSWTEDPRQYGAIHFHEDDLEDAGWAPTRELTIPADWRSGFYALKITSTEGAEPLESYVSFFIKPPEGKPGAEIAVIAPTATYLAYANNHARLDQTHFEVMADGLLIIGRDDAYLSVHRELGLSTYDTHSDGSGVCYSTAARPILNTRPRANTFNYVNDTHCLDWLEEQGFAYDVLTDEDMDRDGARALRPYRVVINLTHPEYYSRAMYDALEAYQNGGGRHMYLGGNGFYWRIAFHPTKRGIIELRRGITGIRSWEAEAGEGNLSFTGEPSGLWRSNGRAPQRLAGVGFSAQVFDFSTSYRRLPGSFEPNAAFIFEGIERDEVIGNFGLRLGGAAGLEIDRADHSLGSPPNIVVLATADRTGPGGVPAPEELPVLYRGFSGEESRLARADMVFFPTAAGGAVFSVGSIAWCCALSHNGYRNNVSQITANVLRRFLDPAPL